jgi:6-phosphogluconolactonase
MKNVELLSFATPDELARAAAGAWLDEIESARRAGQSHSVALSGGRIAQKFFAATATLAVARKTSFASVQFFWADERCVPPSDPESNFRLAEECLFTPLHITSGNIHRLRGEDAPQVALKIAEAELFGAVRKDLEQQPILDLIVLGMGEDGHVASLFPHAIAKNMDISVPFLVVEDSPKPPPLRLSLSYKAIFGAKSVWVLVSGTGKAPALRASLSGKAPTPLAQIINARQVRIFSDLNEF